MTVRVKQVDLCGDIEDESALDRYDHARILLRYGGRIVGQVTVPVRQGFLDASEIRLAADNDVGIKERVCKVAVEDFLSAASPLPDSMTWSVIVCTRDRPEMLPLCLESLMRVTRGLGEIIVVDNAPCTDATLRLVEQYPAVRYVREDEPGLNRARMRGARAANGDFLIYCDDDTVAEEGWIEALLSEFAGARVGAVTGLTMPYELETEAQELFERNGGFIRGFDRRVFDAGSLSPAAAHRVGAGANMALRRDLVISMGLFEAEFDVGTRTRAGGDTHSFSRLLTEGYRIVYTPDGINWHRHRRTRQEMLQTLAGYSTAHHALLTKSLIEMRALPTLRVGWHFWKYQIGRLARALLRRPGHIPTDIVMAEIKGSLRGPFAYIGSRRVERSRRSSSNTVTRRARQ